MLSDADGKEDEFARESDIDGPVRLSNALRGDAGESGALYNLGSFGKNNVYALDNVEYGVHVTGEQILELVFE
ncbi:hypothetical protein BGX28_005008 [Mortierella sp. GBA30]|nr:hypothetical protein BGX28_005008 [Mortierella sp. GBA30]